MSHDTWRRFLLTAMVLSLSWALLIRATGGFVWEISRMRLSSRDPVRPLCVAIVAALLFWYSAPAAVARAMDRLERAIVENCALLAYAAAAVTIAVGLTWGTYAAGGADSYGYVSQSELWLDGRLRIDQSGFQALGPPFDAWTFVPLGYRPGQRPWTIVPTYSPGLPLLMAAAKAVVGPNGQFWVVPVLGGLSVVLTFLLGRLLFDDVVGAGAALLLAASPAFLMQTLSPMSDVPAATAWTLALVFALGSRPFAAGLASSIALVIRPNLAPLAVPVGLVAALGEVVDSGRVRSAVGRAVRFGAAVLPGVAGIAFLNTYLYGGPLESGYGSLARIYHWQHLQTNVTHYTRWLFETQTPLVFASILPLAFRRFTVPRTLGGNWHVRAGLALFLTLLSASYLLYQPFGDWWYLRFLLPGLPVVLVLAVGFLRNVKPLSGAAPWRGHTLLLTAVVMSVFLWEAMVGHDRGVYRLQTIEQRYVTIGRDLARMTPPNAVFFSMQQSGSLRYYTGRMTARYDLLPPGSLDRALDVMRSRGYHPYFLLEQWEEPAFLERFRETSLAGRLDWRPLKKWTRPSVVALYDPAER